MTDKNPDRSTALFVCISFLAIFLACAGAVGCSGTPGSSGPGIPVVHAQVPDCSPERFYGDGSGNLQTPIETPDYLQFASQACVITANVLEQYTLKFDHTVQAADMQMGSNTGSNLEWAFWVDFQLPSGRSFSLFMQYDKHVDNVGNRHEWRPFPVPIKLPAGTVVTIRRPALPAVYCTKPGPWGSGQACGTGQKIELVGTLI
ncbi:MAG TPA: hypothetical protein VN176_07170 [Verrucomicrobiae bacterium]|jgi:hypothetical protein|nr:hypothetical protein [Verrucomicrobiae bacterium]